MIYLYENAIIDDLRYQLGDSRVSLLPPDILFRSIADLSGDDQVELPLISLSRIGYSFNEEPHSSPETLDGTKIMEADEEGRMRFAQVQRVPITCRWQVDVISRSRLDNDNLVRELLFYYINNPTLKVMIPYGLNKEHKFSIWINPDIDDNSDIESHASRGEYFRTTFGITCTDANIWKVTTNSPKKLQIEYHIEEPTKEKLDVTLIPNDILGEGEIK